jgi:hypothetical protein
MELRGLKPNSATVSLNHERSPVILTSAAEYDQRIGGLTSEAMALVKPIDGAHLRIVKEGFDKTDDGGCLDDWVGEDNPVRALDVLSTGLTSPMSVSKV